MSPIRRLGAVLALLWSASAPAVANDRHLKGEEARECDYFLGVVQSVSASADGANSNLVQFNLAGRGTQAGLGDSVNFTITRQPAGSTLPDMNLESGLAKIALVAAASGGKRRIRVTYYHASGAKGPYEAHVIDVGSGIGDLPTNNCTRKSLARRRHK